MSRQRGFSMIELVVAISISAIVVALVTLFLSAPMDIYIAQNRRSELSYAADSVSRMMGEDVRTALPNSLRWQRNGALVVIEMLSVVDSARYRAVSSGGVANQELDFSVADAQFNSLGTLRTLTHPYTSSTQYLALGAAGSNAYALTNTITPTGTTIQITTVAGEDHVTLSPAFQFTTAATTQRIFLVSEPVAYVCDEGARTLARYSGYNIAANLNNRNTAAKLLAAGALDAKVADNINACQAWVKIGAPQQRDLLGVAVQFVASGDRLHLFKQFAVEQLP
jgi:MSHA biogenesis protein MshO